MKEVFTKIYETNGFGSEKSRSGPGSSADRAATVGKELLSVLQRLRITSMLDAPCGDWVWMKELSLPLQRYFGIDIVDEIVERNRTSYGNDTHLFDTGDLTRDPLPKADLIFCRDCLVHLSYTDIFRALSNFQASGARYLLMTNFPRHSENLPIETGAWRPLNFQRAPFCLPRPLDMVPDWCPDPRFADKSLGLWELDRLPPL